MYDTNYANIWIKAYESRKDKYRTDFIEPFLKCFVNNISMDSKIIDIGCGWGTIIEFLKNGQKYVGVDPVENFFPYIRKNFDRELILINDSLPELNKVKGKYDVVICSMVLHTVEDLKSSIKRLKNLLLEGGTLLIIDFRDSAESMLRKSLKKTIISDSKHIRGFVEIASGDLVETDIYFHKEKEIQSALNNFKKQYLGDIFVVYEYK